MPLPEGVERPVLVQTLLRRGRIPGGGIAIVGSRTPPPRALDFAFELALAIERPVIAGLAAGIDTAAHRGALDGGNPTVAFVGYGFGATYPPENAATRARDRERRRCGRDAARAGRAGRRSVARRARSPAGRVRRSRSCSSRANSVGARCTRCVLPANSGNRASRCGRPRGSQVEDAWSGNVRALADGAVPLAFDVSEALQTLRARIDRFPGTAIARRAPRAALAGGCDSPVRSGWGVGAAMFVQASARGAYAYDESGTPVRRLRHGIRTAALRPHASRARRPVSTRSRAPVSSGEARIPKKFVSPNAFASHLPSMERMRFVTTGTEAMMSAVRVARAYTQARASC